jgi:MFS family permease
MSRTERVYYLVVGSYNLSWSFVGAVYAIFLLDRGLDLFEINVVLATYFFASFCFEVPTGAVADLFGRKVSFVASCLVRSGAFWLYYQADGLVDFLIAESVDAVGQTLASGALDAWAVDGTRRERESLGADRLLSRGHLVSHFAMLLAGLTGGYLGQHSLRLPWIAGSISFLLTATLATLVMREHQGATGLAAREPSGRGGVVLRQIGRGFAVVRANPLLRVLLVLIVGIGFATMPFVHYWPPYVQELTGEGTWLLGWVWALLIVAGMVGSWLVPRLVDRWGRAHVAAGANVLRGVGVLVAATTTRVVPGFAGLAAHSVGMSLSIPVVEAWVNDHVAERERATVLSMSAMAFTLGGASGLLALGLVARHGGIRLAWLCSGAIFLGCALGFATLARTQERRPPR